MEALPLSQVPLSNANGGNGGAVISPQNGKGETPAHFGDIMSSRETNLVIPAGYTPLERILLTANGNVQRILSSFHNSKVTVEILKNEQVSDGASPVFHRKVLLMINGKVSCTASSTVTIHDPRYTKLLVEQQVGIGQVFRYLSVLPEFELVDIGRGGNLEDARTLKNGSVKEGFWRKYQLSSPGVMCEIREDFPGDVFETGETLV